MIRAPVNVLEMLPAANAVRAVTTGGVATLARPVVPIQLEPSGKVMAAEMPGIPYVARRRASASDKAARRASIVIGSGMGVGAGVGDGIRLADGLADGLAGEGDGLGESPGALADGEALGLDAAAAVRPLGMANSASNANQATPPASIMARM